MKNMKISRRLLLGGGFLLTGLGFAGVLLPVLPATPFFLGASFCFMKSSPRFAAWLRSNRFIGPRLARWSSGGGMSFREKIFIYLFALACIIPVIVFTRSLHLRIFLTALLVVKGIVFLRIKTTPPP